MARLGGSPLGLIGLMSVPTAAGDSTYNGGKSRNFNVPTYNTGKAMSQFSGKRRLRAWPNISGKKIDASTAGSGEKVIDTTGVSDVYEENGKRYDNSIPSYDGKTKGSNLLHNNDVYDTSVLNIVEKLSGTKAALRPSDFAYLKDLGVYPNNRLMIARRFHSPSGNNIMVKAREYPSMATLISWVPENDNFLEFSFGEVWVEAKADFTGMLNSLGEDFGAKGLGNIASAGANILPLPGFTEIFQRKFLAELGLMNEGAAEGIPAGNPNLIKEAKVRKTIPYSEPGAGLTAKISVKMVCEYELKFISGIDPTIVWMDLLSMIMRFGSSDSSNYGLSQNVAATLARWASNPASLINDVATKLKKAIESAVDFLDRALTEAFNAATAAAQKLSDAVEGEEGSSGSSAKQKSERELAMDAAKEAKALGKKMISKLLAVAQKAVKGSILKYRVEMMGIVNALTGNPSTPWHLTIGNPMRPVFCSGDMYTTEVTVKLGPTLAFNDLPSSITVEFTLQNARALGVQELMSRFNSGYLRTVDTQRSYLETTIISNKAGDTTSEEQPGSLPGEGLITYKYETAKENPNTSGNGSNGSNGSNGNAVNQGGGGGDLGSMGTKGTSGSNGSSGTDGSNGSNGSQGKTDVPGSGTQGTKGTNGDQSRIEDGKIPAKK